MSDPMLAAGEVVIDTAAELSDRIAALCHLSDLDIEKALQVAIAVTENPEESSAVFVAMGKGIARIASSHRWLTEFEVRNMDDSAYEAYCEYLE